MNMRIDELNIEIEAVMSAMEDSFFVHELASLKQHKESLERELKRLVRKEMAKDE
jgi:hypothetical protein